MVNFEKSGGSVTWHYGALPTSVIQCGDHTEYGALMWMNVICGTYYGIICDYLSHILFTCVIYLFTCVRRYRPVSGIRELPQSDITYNITYIVNFSEFSAYHNYFIDINTFSLDFTT